MKPEGAGRHLEADVSEVLYLFTVHTNALLCQIVNSLDANEVNKASSRVTDYLSSADLSSVLCCLWTFILAGFQGSGYKTLYIHIHLYTHAHYAAKSESFTLTFSQEVERARQSMLRKIYYLTDEVPHVFFTLFISP